MHKYYCTQVLFQTTTKFSSVRSVFEGRIFVAYLVYDLGQTKLQVIHIHLVIRKMFIALVQNDQQSFYLHYFHIIILPVHFCDVKFQSIASLFSYSIIMYQPYDIKLYTILHIKSSHPNSEDIVNVNRLYVHNVVYIMLLVLIHQVDSYNNTHTHTHTHTHV